MPTVSVVIPTYNSAKYIGTAVDSVLAQSFRDLEVMVIDDGSTDQTPQVMARYGPPVRYIRQKNSGVSAARNRGIQESIGEYVAFLDADDTWLPKKLDIQIRALEQSQAERACYSAYLVCTESLKPIGVQRNAQKKSTLQDLVLRGNVIGSICSVLCDRWLFRAVGDFDETLSQCADWDMWVRLATLTDFTYVDEALVTYRQHGSNMSRDPELLERDSLHVLEKAFRDPGLPRAVLRRRRESFARNYMVLAGTYFYARGYRDFLRCVIQAVSLDSRQLGYIAAFPWRRIRRAFLGGRPIGQWREVGQR